MCSGLGAAEYRHCGQRSSLYRSRAGGSTHRKERELSELSKRDTYIKDKQDSGFRVGICRAGAPVHSSVALEIRAPNATSIPDYNWERKSAGSAICRSRHITASFPGFCYAAFVAGSLYCGERRLDDHAIAG